ncbi:MAG: hypothetical protein V4787_08145 [Pseudomonadota bacterium]
MNIDQYRTAVEALAAGKSDRRFSNKGSQHAAVVVQQMFHTAADRVRIFSGALSPDIYLQEPVKQEIETFLSRAGTSLQVITQKPINEATAAFLSHFDRVKICSLNGEKTAAPIEHHFLVADSRAYRLETDEENREAVVNFNEPRVAASLNAMFDRALACAPMEKVEPT